MCKTPQGWSRHKIILWCNTLSTMCPLYCLAPNHQKQGSRATNKDAFDPCKVKKYRKSYLVWCFLVFEKYVEAHVREKAFSFSEDRILFLRRSYQSNFKQSRKWEMEMMEEHGAQLTNCGHCSETQDRKAGIFINRSHTIRCPQDDLYSPGSGPSSAS